MQNETDTLMKTTANTCIKPSLKPIRGNRARIITACIVDIIVPLRAFPTTIESLDTGATRISFINPNSLSQIMDIDEKIELKRIVMPIIPGKMNCVYDTPAPRGTSLDSPGVPVAGFDAAGMSRCAR